jgi:DNA-binding GntR family transcriptional regulator
VREQTILAVEKAAAPGGHREANRAFHPALAWTLRNHANGQIVKRLWAEMTSPPFTSMGAMSGLFGTGGAHDVHHDRRIIDAHTCRGGAAAKAAMQALLFEVRRTLPCDPAVAEPTLHTDPQ